MKTLNEIKTILPKQKSFLNNTFNVRSIGIFGSYVRDQQTSTSEVIGIKLDLVMKDALKPRIGQYILKELVLIGKNVKGLPGVMRVYLYQDQTKLCLHKRTQR